MKKAISVSGELLQTAASVKLSQAEMESEQDHCPEPCKCQADCYEARAGCSRKHGGVEKWNNKQL